MADQKKRKTHTSNEVIMKYRQKTYTQYIVNFRKEGDEDLIEMVESEKSKGIGTTEAFRNLLRNKEK